MAQIIETAPPGAPNVFLVGVTQAQVEPLKELIAKQAGGAAGRRNLSPACGSAGEHQRGEGTDTEGWEARRFAYRGRDVGEEIPADRRRFLEGAWWQAGTRSRKFRSRRTAKALNFKPGDLIEMHPAGERFARAWSRSTNGSNALHARRLSSCSIRRRSRGLPEIC